MDRYEVVEVSRRLKGCDISAITFVKGYLQFHFDGPYINAYVWPQVITPKQVFSAGMPGYRDALCEQIGKPVAGVFEEANQTLAIQLNDGTAIEISLKEENRQSAEAAMYQDGTGQHWNIW